MRGHEAASGNPVRRGTVQREMLKLLAFLLAVAACAPVPTQAPREDIVPPPAALVLDGVPPIPLEIAKKVHPYGEFLPHGLFSWHPGRREMLVRRRLNTTNQVFLVREPGAQPVPITDQAEAIFSAEYDPVRGDSFVFTRAEGGNEVYQLYRYDFATNDAGRITGGDERASSWRWSEKGDAIAYTTQPVDRRNPERIARTTLHLVDPRDAKTDKVLARLEGGGWGGFHFSEDGSQLAFTEYKSRNESHL